MFPLRVYNPSRITPWVTWGFMLACILTFAFQAIQPPVVQSEIMGTYALVPARVFAALQGKGDPSVLATVVSSMFMHGGLLHIAGNMWFLKLFGDSVEDRFGSWRYAIFFVLCGLGAAVAQVAVQPSSPVPMVGASGAIAGVLAAYLVLYPRGQVLTLFTLGFFYRVVQLPAFVVIALWFGLQFFSGLASLGVLGAGGVAYWAHVGGFAVGLALAGILRAWPSRPHRARALGEPTAWELPSPGK